jgi:hypothetical protein
VSETERETEREREKVMMREIYVLREENVQLWLEGLRLALNQFGST